MGVRVREIVGVVVGVNEMVGVIEGVIVGVSVGVGVRIKEFIFKFFIEKEGLNFPSISLRLDNKVMPGLIVKPITITT